MATNKAGTSTAARMLASKASGKVEKTVAGSALTQSRVAKVSAALSSASKAVGAFSKPNTK